MSSSGQLDSGGAGGPNPWDELFERYLDRSNPNLLGKVDFGGILADSGRAIVAAVFVGISSIILAVFTGVRTVIDAAETGMETVLLSVGLSPQQLIQPAQAATAAAVGEAGVLGLPVGVGTQLASFGVLALVIALAWGWG